MSLKRLEARLALCKAKEARELARAIHELRGAIELLDGVCKACPYKAYAGACERCIVREKIKELRERMEGLLGLGGGEGE